jgi:hypothetical protein
MSELAERIRLRLAPPAAAALDNEAQAMLDLHSGLDWFKAAMAAA